MSATRLYCLTEEDLKGAATKRTCAPTSLWMTRQPSQRANTEPLAHACGLTALVLVSPQMLHVNRTCSEITVAPLQTPNEQLLQVQLLCQQPHLACPPFAQR